MRLKSWQSLLFKVRHLNLEVEDRTELIREHSAEFERRVLREMGEAAPPVPVHEDTAERGLAVPGEDEESSRATDDHEEHGGAEAKPGLPESAKKLWRSIAIKTHPDRVGTDGELGQLYRRAAAAWNDGELAPLVGVAIELGIPIEPDPSFRQALQSLVEESERKLGDMEKMAVWRWIMAEPEDKSAIVKQTSEILSRNRKENQ